jgi:hypothetical protein
MLEHYAHGGSSTGDPLLKVPSLDAFRDISRKASDRLASATVEAHARGAASVPTQGMARVRRHRRGDAASARLTMPCCASHCARARGCCIAEDEQAYENALDGLGRAARARGTPVLAFVAGMPMAPCASTCTKVECAHALTGSPTTPLPPPSPLPRALLTAGASFTDAPPHARAHQPQPPACVPAHFGASDAIGSYALPWASHGARSLPRAPAAPSCARPSGAAYSLAIAHAAAFAPRAHPAALQPSGACAQGVAFGMPSMRADLPRSAGAVDLRTQVQHAPTACGAARGNDSGAALWERACAEGAPFLRTLNKRALRKVAQCADVPQHNRTVDNIRTALVERVAALDATRALHAPRPPGASAGTSLDGDSEELGDGASRPDKRART